MNIDETAFEEILDELIPKIRGEPANHGFALGDGALALLGAIIQRFGVKKVFEFGSGRSTKEFLELGCLVFCVEDNQHWLDETLKTIPAERMAGLRSAVLPLRTVWHHGVPMKAWEEEAVAPELRNADLVLIDSPSYPPFREYPLILSMKHATNAIIILDDANIPTVDRFCKRLASDRSRVLSCSTSIGHGLFILARLSRNGEIESGRGAIETAKAWRRFVFTDTVEG